MSEKYDYHMLYFLLCMFRFDYYHMLYFIYVLVLGQLQYFVYTLRKTEL